MLYALTLGCKVGLVTINSIFIPWHENQITRYGPKERIVGVRAVETDVGNYIRAFEDELAYEGIRKQFLKQAEPLLEMGVEVIEMGVKVIIPAGGLPMLLCSREKDFAIGGATVLNCIKPSRRKRPNLL